METIKTIGWILLLWIISPFITVLSQGGNIMQKIRYILILLGILGIVITLVYLI